MQKPTPLVGNFLLFVLVIPLLGFNGCDYFKKENSAVIGTIDSIGSLNPDKSFNYESDLILGSVYDTLIAIDDRSGQSVLMPSLLKELPKISEDKRTYSFELKEGIKFHDHSCFKKQEDKRILTTEDVLFSLKRAVHLKQGQRGHQLIGNMIVGLGAWGTTESPQWQTAIDGLRSISDTQFEIILTKPNSEFLSVLASPILSIMSKACLQSLNFDVEKSAIGTGPFQLDSFGKSIELSRYKEYRDSKFPKLDKITFKHEMANADAFPATHRGSMDAFFLNQYLLPGITEKGELQKGWQRKGLSLVSWPDKSTTYLAFNLKNKLFIDKPKLREAMALAIDINAVHQKIIGHLATPATSLIPSTIFGFSFAFRPNGPNVERAKNLLQEMGNPMGQGLPIINVEFVESPVSQLALTEMKTQFSQIGLSVNARANNWADIFKRLSTQATDIVMLTWVSPTNTPSYFYQVLNSTQLYPNGANASFYENSEFDAIFANLRTTTDIEGTVNRLNEFINTDYPLVPLLHPNTGLALNSWLKGAEFTAFRYDALKDLSIDEDERKLVLSQIK